MSEALGQSPGAAPSWEQLKELVYQCVSRDVERGRVGFHSSDAIRQEICARLEHACRTELPPLHPQDLERLRNELMHDVFGFGPLEPLFADPTITDILVNGPYRV